MWQIYGQEHIIRQLDAALKADRLSHAYLLVGPPHVGKMALAVGMAQAVNCLAAGRQATRQQHRPTGSSPATESAAGMFALDDVEPGTASSRLLEDSGQYVSGPGTNVCV